MADRGIQLGETAALGDVLSLDRIQSRIVLGLLLGGSFAGVWLAHWGSPPLSRVLWWAIVIANGTLVGGLYWRVVLFDASRFDDTNTARWVQNRWRRLETVSVWSFALCAAAGLSLAPSGIGTAALGAGAVVSPVLWVGIRRGGVDGAGSARRTAYVRAALLTSTLVALGGFAWLETGTSIVDWAVRFGHVGSFALWIGGALWHNSLIIPVLRSSVAADALKQQADRFRRHLPAVILLFFVTGTYQTMGVIDLSLAAFLGSAVGRLIGVKLLVLLVLTGLVLANLVQAASTRRGRS